MKLNSLSVIIVLSLFAAMYSNSVTVRIDMLNNKDILVCLSLGDSLTIELLPTSYAINHRTNDRNILKQREGENEVYYFTPKENGKFTFYFPHIMHLYASPLKHYPSNRVYVEVKEECSFLN